MKDFDFDELDRAVSSVLSESPEQTPPLNEAEVQSAPARDTPSVQPREVAPRQARSGRVMDIVRPVSTSRVVPSTVAPQQETPVAPLPRKEVPMGDITLVKRSEVAQPVVEQPQEQPQEEPTPIEDEAWDVPESPFLPDAKVEKRPLGQSEPTGEALVTVEAEAPSIVAVPEEAPSVEVPAISTDLEAESVPEFDAFDTEESPLEDGAETAREVHIEPEPVASPQEPLIPVGPVEITQQYTAKPADTPASGELFDTEAYHTPFTAPVKKMSGLKVTLIVIASLLFVAALAAGFYFYVLPLL